MAIYICITILKKIHVHLVKNENAVYLIWFLVVMNLTFIVYTEKLREIYITTMILPSPVQQYSSPFESYLSNPFTMVHALHGPWQVFIKCMYFFIAFLYCTRIRLEDNENMNQNVTQTPELCSNPMLSTTELHLHIVLFWNIRVQSVLEKYSVIVCNSFL